MSGHGRRSTATADGGSRAPALPSKTPASTNSRASRTAGACSASSADRSHRLEGLAPAANAERRDELPRRCAEERREIDLCANKGGIADIYTMVRVSLGKRGAMLTVRRHWSTRTTTRVAARCRNGSRETSDVPWVARPSGRSGGDDRTRTDDPLLAKQVLYQLSYVPAADTRSAHD